MQTNTERPPPSETVLLGPRHLPGQAIIKLSSRLEFRGKAGRGPAKNAHTTCFPLQSPLNRQGQCINFTGQSTHPGLCQARSLGSSRACRGALLGQHLLHRSSVEGLPSCSPVFVPVAVATQWPTASLNLAESRKKYRRILRYTREPTPKLWEL